MKYNKKSYENILATALKKGFKFVDFSTVDVSNKKRQMLLRHDIDYSVSLAYKMAETDAAYKIKSTFAVLLTSPLYNPFTPTNVKLINGIHQLGHNVVLHHHVEPGQSAADIKKDIRKESKILKEYFPYLQGVFVWHDLPAKNLMSEIKIPGLINAYDKQYIEKMFYISDSVLRHKPEVFIKSLEEQKFIHMLLHPIIWVSGQDDMIAMVSRILTGIIKDCDTEFMVNRAWKVKYPKGIPRDILDELHRRLSK